ncbi:hypothetical protein Tco_0046653 [Tanacetum coccineum]
MQILSLREAYWLYIVLILSSNSVLMGDFEFLGGFVRVRRCREEGAVPDILGAVGDMGAALSKAFWT